jgi:hypothetical protein
LNPRPSFLTDRDRHLANALLQISKRCALDNRHRIGKQINEAHEQHHNEQIFAVIELTM